MNVIKIGIHNISDTDFKASLPKVSEAVKYSLTGPEVITTGIITPRNINKDFQFSLSVAPTFKFWFSTA